MVPTIEEIIIVDIFGFFLIILRIFEMFMFSPLLKD